MSGYPLLLEGTGLDVLVVGGGRVAHRKAVALLESGATVRVIAPEIGAELREVAGRWPRLALVERPYRGDDIGDAVLVIAATNVRDVNAAVTTDALSRGRLVNVADFPEDGNCVTVASHAVGPLVVGVSAGGVPDAAVRVRDAIADRFDGRYETALTTLVALRRALLDEGDRDGWHAAKRDLIGGDFCVAVEGNGFGTRVAAWRARRADGGVDADGPSVEGATWGS
jgi:precorrin-2 dehydrogenase / sirohydrochlorin ferrochelatase